MLQFFLECESRTLLLSSKQSRVHPRKKTRHLLNKVCPRGISSKNAQKNKKAYCLKNQPKKSHKLRKSNKSFDKTHSSIAKISLNNI